jgi:hypothetical protein
MGARGDRLAQRQSDQRQSRITNGHLKKKERKRRDDRMRGLLKLGKPPYTPAVRSWLSAKLGKPSGRITPADVKKVLESAST